MVGARSTARGTHRSRAPPTPSPARPARRRCTPWPRTPSTTPRPSTSGCAITLGSLPSRRRRRRASRSPCSQENAGFGAMPRRPLRARCIDAYLLDADGSRQSRSSRETAHMKLRETGTPCRASRPPPAHAAPARRACSLGAEARRPAAHGPRADRRLRTRRCSTARPGQSVPTVIARSDAHLGMGAVAMLLLAQVNPELPARSSPWLYVSACAAHRGRAHRPHRQGRAALARSRDMRFQPSELMKLAVPMMCAWYLHERPLPPSCRRCCCWRRSSSCR